MALDKRQTVRAFLGDLLKTKGDSRGFTDHESLVASGRLASMDVLHVVLFLEERHGVDFSDGFDQNELDSVDSIVSLIDGSGR
jgi:acyl carrier protein